MHTPLAATKDTDTESAAKPDKGDRLEEQLSFKSRFVLVFGEIDDGLAQAACRRLLAFMERDFWMSAGEAVNYGIVSRIIERQTELP